MVARWERLGKPSTAGWEKASDCLKHLETLRGTGQWSVGDPVPTQPDANANRPVRGTDGVWRVNGQPIEVTTVQPAVVTSQSAQPTPALAYVKQRPFVG
jgi:hypothetical protein